MKEYEAGYITEESMRKHVDLQISCGMFSYAHIPSLFDTLLGVTGTLETLSSAQRRIIVEDYNLHEDTYIPSIFGRNNLRFSDTKDLFVKTRENYFIQIRKQIDVGLLGNTTFNKRAVLVFFDCEKKMKEFYESKCMVDLR